jgi:hypothetical protein
MLGWDAVAVELGELGMYESCGIAIFAHVGGSIAEKYIPDHITCKTAKHGHRKGKSARCDRIPVPAEEIYFASKVCINFI